MQKVTNLLNKHKVIIKYLIAGSIASSAAIISLYILSVVLKIWYLAASTLAFIIAFFISFSLQKFWTFRDNNFEKIKKQLSLYFLVSITNLAINTIFMYTLVDRFKIWHIYSQILTCGFLAIISFLIYKFKIFNQKISAENTIIYQKEINE